MFQIKNPVIVQARSQELQSTLRSRKNKEKQHQGCSWSRNGTRRCSNRGSNYRICIWGKLLRGEGRSQDTNHKYPGERLVWQCRTWLLGYNFGMHDEYVCKKLNRFMDTLRHCLVDTTLIIKPVDALVTKRVVWLVDVALRTIKNQHLDGGIMMHIYRRFRAHFHQN